MTEEYQCFICDKAENEIHSKGSKKLCDSYNLNYLLIPYQHNENPNIVASYPLDYITQEIIARDSNSDISILIDSDMFLVRAVSFRKYIANYKIGSVYQKRKNVFYLLNALIIINHRQIAKEDFTKIIFADSGSEESKYSPHHLFKDRKILGQYVDVGGPMYFFINNRKNKIKYISASRVTKYYNNIDLLPNDVRRFYLPFYSSDFGKGEKSLIASDMLKDNTFFHYRAGSNWNGLSKKAMKFKILVLKRILVLAFEKKIPKKRIFK